MKKIKCEKTISFEKNAYHLSNYNIRYAHFTNLIKINKLKD